MSHGFRNKTRRLLTKKGNKGFSDQILRLKNLKQGDEVVIMMNPSYHKGMPHKRYHGRVGIIKRRRGRAYEVKVTKGNKEVLLIVPPEHLKEFSK